MIIEQCDLVILLTPTTDVITKHTA